MPVLPGLDAVFVQIEHGATAACMESNYLDFMAVGGSVSDALTSPPRRRPVGKCWQIADFSARRCNLPAVVARFGVRPA